MIELRQAEVRYPSGTRVGPLDLQADDRALVLVTGPNGSGKTTLLELLAGRLRASRGRVVRPSRRGALAVLPQRHRFHDQLPVRVEDLVGFAALAHGWFRRPDSRQVTAALERARAGNLAGRLVRELSGGQRQLAHLARLLAQQADFWLLDEPLAGLDPEWRRRVLDLLDSVHHNDGVGMLVVSHLHDERPAGCGRALVLEGGRLVADGPPAEVLGEPIAGTGGAR